MIEEKWGSKEERHLGTDHVTNMVGCRWVYTQKHKTDGSLERARIVAKGFTQNYGIDYLETFAPLAKLNSIPYESFCQLQLTNLGHCISSMSKRPFFI